MLGKPTAAVPSSASLWISPKDFLLGGNPKCNGEGPDFPSLTDESMNVCYCILLCSPLILIPPLNARFNLITPSKILNFGVSGGVSGECLGGVWWCQTLSG